MGTKVLKNERCEKEIRFYFHSLPFELQHLWQLLPFAFVGNLKGAAAALSKDINGIVLALKGGREVFAAEVVDKLQAGLALTNYLTRRDGPAEGVVKLAQIAGQLAIEFLSGDGDILVVEADAKKHFILFIKKVRAKSLVSALS